MNSSENIENKRAFPVMTEWDRMHMAYHEAGHAICCYFLPEKGNPIRVTIEPSDEAFGILKSESRKELNETFVSLKGSISTFLAGRLSEEIFLKDITTSCIHDLIVAKEIAFDMVTKYGMGEISRFSAIASLGEYTPSDSMKQKIEEDMQHIIEAAELDARTILERKSRCVETMAKELLIKGTLLKDEINKIIEENS